MRKRSARIIRDATTTARQQWGSARVVNQAWIGTGLWAKAYNRTRYRDPTTTETKAATINSELIVALTPTSETKEN
jgi:hypothetical protein